MARTYHRKIRILANGDRVTGDLVDDPHHFRVHMRHDGQRVTALESEAIRYPWTPCPEAARPLQELVGMPLSPRCNAVGEQAPASHQCTHLFDLAGLTVAHAAAGRKYRLYHCVVAGNPGEIARATLHRDGDLLLDWEIHGGIAESTLHAAPPFDGIPLTGGFMAWAMQNLDPELAEAAIVLRRGCMIGGVRFYDLDEVSTAPEMGGLRGRCFTYTPGRVERAYRVRGTRRDFSHGHEPMLGSEPAGKD